MLKRRTIRKLLVSTSALFTLFLIYLVPKDTILNLENIPQELEYVNKEIQKQEIYLLNNYNLLAKTEVAIDSKNTIQKVKELVEILIKDGSGENKIPSGFRSYIPSEAKILSVNIENNILKINFSKELLNTTIELEERIIEGLVYTLTGIEEIENIILYVEGNILTQLPQKKLTIPGTLNRNFGINKQYNLETLKDITQVTTYYISKYNEDYYYVPVTNYINDEREKIRIVVDNLTSTPIYNTNLMSFLNSNTKLLAVEQTNEILDLTFNQYIFHNLEEQKILEEVIYTICLSIKDNYDVKEVIFHVNEEEIYKSVLKKFE